MFMSKECTYITYYHFRPGNHIGSGLITCNMGHPLKKLGMGEAGGW